MHKRRVTVAVAVLALAMVVAAAVAFVDGGQSAEPETSAAMECAAAWNRTAGAEDRKLLNMDAQVARGSEQDRRVRLLVTRHAGAEERIALVPGGEGVARPGACLVVGRLGMTFVQRPAGDRWDGTQAQSFGPLSAYVRRVLAEQGNAHVEAPIAGLEDPTPRDGLILDVEGAPVPR